MQLARTLRLNVVDIFESGLPGKEGNIEYWLYLTK